MFKKGDRVHLNHNLAVSLKKGKIDWLKREGTVVANPYMGSDTVAVQWDDAKQKDHWPRKALEKIE